MSFELARLSNAACPVLRQFFLGYESSDRVQDDSVVRGQPKAPSPRVYSVRLNSGVARLRVTVAKIAK